MNFPRLTFPLTVDFGDNRYWIGEQGPFKYGAAVTTFFIMKGNMSEADFKAWVTQAEADRDAAIEQIKPSVDAVMKAYIINQLKEKLNCQ